MKKILLSISMLALAYTASANVPVIKSLDYESSRGFSVFPKSLHERYRKSENILSINDLEDCVRKEC